jgi:hypothetical protein
LGKSNGDWCWLVGDEVLEVTSGDVSIHKFEKTIGIRFADLGKSSSNWGSLISDKSNKSALGNVLTVKFTNDVFNSLSLDHLMSMLSNINV